MSDIAIKIEDLSKQYRLGQVGTGTISHDLNRWWYQVRGKEDPYLKIGQSNNRTQAGGDYVWALKDINFEVKQGEILGIIGKNGAGKSTLLKLLSKVTSPTTGSIKARGRIASLLEVGTGFHPEMTGRENIFMNGTIMGMNRHEIKARLEEIVEFAGIAKYLDTPVKRYSSGMTVRLGFAIAAHLEPEILIVDEVLAVGDTEFQQKAIGKMQDVSKGQGRTVLFVSHNMRSVEKLCNTSLIIKNGSIDFSGDVYDGIKHYLNSANSLTNLKISERTDRLGKGGFLFSQLDYLDSSNGTRNAFQSGENITFKTSYCHSEETLNDVVIKIEIISSIGNSMTVMNNYHCGSPFKQLPSTGKVLCTLKKNPLPTGKYSINLSCYVVEGGDKLILLDHIESASELLIENGDFFGTGRVPKNIKEGVFMDHHFSFTAK